MKTLACVILCFLSVLNLSKVIAQDGATGNMYQDAVLFVNGIKEADSKFLSVISYYFNDPEVSIAEAQAFLHNHPFLASYEARVNMLAAAVPSTTASPTGFGSNIGGMQVTKFADGAAKFLIERGKLEISMTFFSTFNKELKKYPELKTLFPRSSEIVQKVETYNFQNLLQELRDAFTKDLNNMPTNILALKNMNTADCGSDSDCVTRVNNVKNVFTSGEVRPLTFSLIAMQGAIDGNNIIEIINRMVSDTVVCPGTVDDFNGYLKLASIMLEMFRSSATDGSLFINQSQLRDLFTSPDLFRVFVGLGFQKYNSMTCYANLQISSDNLQAIFNDFLTNQQLVYTSMGTFDKINVTAVGIVRQLKANQKIESNQYVTLISSSLTLIENLHRTISRGTGSTLGPNHNRFFTNLSIATEIAVDIEKKNYAGIFNGAIKFLNENVIITDSDTKEKLVKYLAFGANIASATTSDEVKEAIDAIALPPGSYSIKQKSSFTISLNGYIGYSWDFNSGIYMRGVYAPLGVTFSTGISKKCNCGSLSIFSSLIDIGGIAAYRLEDGSTDELKQEVRLESIFSPSVQFQYGIPKTPLAVTAGWRYTPKLFYSGDTDPFTTVNPKSVLNLSILVDIPIATLFNRSFN